jgi:hypothetical protein
MAYQNPQYAGNANFYSPLSRMSDEEEDKTFGAGMGGSSIEAVGGGFKEKNTLKMIGKTAAQIVGTVYGGPAGGMAAGMAVDAMVPDKQSVKSGTSGFGSQQGSTNKSGTSMQQGGSSNMGNVAALAAQSYDQYQAGQKAAGPLADKATQMALDENTADLASGAYAPASNEVVNQTGQKVAEDTAADGAGNAVMWAKAAYDISNKLNESGVMASESAGGPTMNMDTSGVNMAGNIIQTNGPLNPQLEEENPYKKNLSAFAPLGGGRNYG